MFYMFGSLRKSVGVAFYEVDDGSECEGPLMKMEKCRIRKMIDMQEQRTEELGPWNRRNEGKNPSKPRK